MAKWKNPMDRKTRRIVPTQLSEDRISLNDLSMGVNGHYFHPIKQSEVDKILGKHSVKTYRFTNERDFAWEENRRDLAGRDKDEQAENWRDE